MDIKRLTSALLGFPLVVLILTFGNKYVVDIFLMIVAMLGMQEYFNAVAMGRLFIMYCNSISTYFARKCTRTNKQNDIINSNTINKFNIICTCNNNKYENKL